MGWPGGSRGWDRGEWVHEAISAQCVIRAGTGCRKWDMNSQQ